MSHDPSKPVRRVPEGGLQPQVATSADGAVHLRNRVQDLDTALKGPVSRLS